MVHDAAGNPTRALRAGTHRPDAPTDHPRRAAVIRTACLTLLPIALAASPVLGQPTSTQPDADQPRSENAAPDLPPAKASGVALDGNGGVELHVADMPISEALQLLSLEGKRNIIASPDVSGTVTANLYGVTFEQALEAILTPNGAGFRKIGPFVYVYTIDELEAMDAPPDDERVTRVFRLSYINAADAHTYVTPMLGEGESATASPEPSVSLANTPADGGGSGNAAQDFLIVTASAQKLERIEHVLSQLDVRPKQVLIEATILRAQLNDANGLGIDFSIVGGVDLEQLGATSNAIQDLTLGQLPKERLELFNAIGTTDFADQVPSGGFTLGIIKDKVAVFLRALEQVTDTTVLANPKILALNKQKGQVIVGRRDGYLTTTVTETQTIQSVEFLVTGTQLIFRPFIGDDGWVRMELHPEDSVGFVSAQGLPSEQTTEVTTNVLVKDGQTILIGGLFREVTTATNQQIPGLGNLPFLGSLVRSQNDSSDREEVVILLTIKIVKDQDEYADASNAVLEDMERIRVGSRRRLLWHGRERIAQTQYRKALEKLKVGDTRKALWHAELALDYRPRLLSAIRLKERLSAHRDWDLEGTATRNFLYRLIAKDRHYVIPPYGRPDLDRIHHADDANPQRDAPSKAME